MIEIVTGENAHLHQDILDDMFRLRHDIVVGELGWDDQRRADNRDIDQFDTDDTTYVICVDDDRKVLGSSRLLKTTGPHMMSEIFSDMCRGGVVPTGDHINELSRVVARPEARHSNGARAISQVIVGEMEHSLAMGVTHFTMVTEVRMFSRFLENGWQLKILGIPRENKDGMNEVAGIGEFDEIALEATRRRHNVWHDVLNYTGMADPRVPHKEPIPAQVASSTLPSAH